MGACRYSRDSPHSRECDDLSSPLSRSARTNARRLWWRYKHYSTRTFAGDNGRIQDDRGAIRQQRKRLLHREKQAFHIDVEDRVIVLLRYLAEGGILRNTGIREHNVEPALLPFDLCEEAIQIAKVRHVSWYAGYVSSDVLYRRSQLRTTAPRYEDVCAFVHKLLRRRKPMPPLPPVISAIFPSSLPMYFSLLVPSRLSSGGDT